MATRDYYEVLGVARDADADTVKKAYRKLAMEHHPDRNKGDAKAEQRFKDVNQAYDVLKDPQKKAAYDRFGHAAFEAGGMGAAGAGGGAGAAGARGFGDFTQGFADIFEEMFGDSVGGRGRGGQGARGRGSDLRYNLEVDLATAFAGKEARIRVPTSIACDSCNGSGAEGGAAPTTCPSCGGAGRMRAQQGFFTIERTCPTCAGAGQVIDKPCRKCSGAGRVQRDRTLTVNIPAGVEDGTRIRLAGEGEAGVRGGPAGDLYIFVSVKPHPVFRRDGRTLKIDVPIAMTVAALGGQVEVPTVDGPRARITVPAGTQSGQTFRLRGKGLSGLRQAQRGDMLVEVKVETPVNLTARQKELLKEFAQGAPGGGRKSNSPQTEGFLSKMKELWDDLTEK
ncbi:MAG: molecular chaperone DnaJ [Alphaproteobacteria bacterium]